MHSAPHRISCLIIDDEAPARRVVAKYLSDITGYEVKAECKNAFEARDAMREYRPQLIFLDINMPKLNGLKLLETLKNPPLVVITTAYREYAVEGFEMDVVDYLHKPFSLSRFIQALDKVQQRLSAGNNQTYTAAETGSSEADYIFIKVEGEMLRIAVNRIDYVEAVGDYVQVVTAAEKYLTYLSMKKMMTLLSGADFHRIHKSYIVNLSHINSISGSSVFIRSRHLPIGGNYRTPFMEAVKSHMA